MTSSTVRRILLGVAACALMGCGGAPVGAVDSMPAPVVEGGDAGPELGVDAGAVEGDAAVLEDAGSVADTGTPAQDAGGHVEAPDAHVAMPDAAPLEEAAAPVPEAGMPEAAPGEAAAPIVVVCVVPAPCVAPYCVPPQTATQSFGCDNGNAGITYTSADSGGATECDRNNAPKVACPSGDWCVVAGNGGSADRSGHCK